MKITEYPVILLLLTFSYTLAQLPVVDMRGYCQGTPSNDTLSSQLKQELNIQTNDDADTVAKVSLINEGEPKWANCTYLSPQAYCKLKNGNGTFFITGKKCDACQCREDGSVICLARYCSNASIQFGFGAPGVVLIILMLLVG